MVRGLDAVAHAPGRTSEVMPISTADRGNAIRLAIWSDCSALVLRGTTTPLEVSLTSQEVS